MQRPALQPDYHCKGAQGDKSDVKNEAGGVRNYSRKDVSPGPQR
jgi:hypothetical protein